MLKLPIFNKELFLLLGATLLSVVIFFPSLQGEPIMDDWEYIIENLQITHTVSPLGFWTSLEQADYWPLSYTLFWGFYHLFGNTSRFSLALHLTNLILHSFNALLVFRIARRAGVQLAFFAGLFFLIHPLHVQAVSWMIQLKTVLSTCLALISFDLFLKVENNHSRCCLKWSWFTFLMATLTKTSVIFMPLGMVVIKGIREKKRQDYYPLIPYFLISFFGGISTLWVNSLNQSLLKKDPLLISLSPFQVLLFMTQNLEFYFKKFLFPYPLAYLYPKVLPSITSVLSSSFFGLTLTLFICFIFFSKFRYFWKSWTPKRSNPFLVLYLILLFPALGLVTIPNMKLSFVADHWAYFPDVFLWIWIFKGLEEILLRKKRFTIALYGLATPLAFLSFIHAKTFSTEESFWLQAKKVNPDSAIPYYNLGTGYDRKNKFQDALQHYENAVRLDPDHYRAWNNLGCDLVRLNRRDEALTPLQEAILVNPNCVEAFYTLGMNYRALKKWEKAIQTLKQGLESNPNNPVLMNSLDSILKEYSLKNSE